MPRPWLTFLSIGIATAIVFAFFVLRLQPIKTAPTAAETAALAPITQPTVTFADPVRGAKAAEVTLVQFSDFQCEACKELSENLKAVMRSYPDTVRLVWKDMPNESAHPLATLASIAAGCAGRQGKFWEYHDELFDRQAYLSEEEFLKIATDLALKADSFKACYDAHDTLAVVRKGYEEGQALKILSTPTIYIGSTSYTGALSIEELSKVIQKALAETK